MTCVTRINLFRDMVVFHIELVSASHTSGEQCALICESRVADAGKYELSVFLIK